MNNIIIVQNETFVQTPAGETVNIFYSIDAGKVQGIDENRNLIDWTAAGGTGGNLSMLLPRLEESGTVIITGAIAGGNADIDPWIDRNGYSGTVTITFEDFQDPAISQAAGMTLLDGYSNGTSGALMNLVWTALAAGDYTFNIVFRGTGLTTVTRPCILRLS